MFFKANFKYFTLIFPFFNLLIGIKLNIVLKIFKLHLLHYYYLYYYYYYYYFIIILLLLLLFFIIPQHIRHDIIFIKKCLTLNNNILINININNKRKIRNILETFSSSLVWNNYLMTSISWNQNVLK